MIVEKFWREFFADPSQWWDHWSGKVPELFTTSPALAIPKAIASAGIDQSQVNFYYS
jgi:hypothetical protein